MVSYIAQGCHFIFPIYRELRYLENLDKKPVTIYGL